MANILAPFGFRAVRRIDGAAPNFLINPRLIASNDTTPIGYGDCVTSLATGYITRSTAGTTAIAGIFQGCEYYDNNMRKYVQSMSWSGTASTSGPITCYVLSDPYVVFEAQSNGAPITFADTGTNINFAVGSPNALSGISTFSLNASSINPATTTLPFRVIGPSSKIGVDNTSNYNIAEVVLNFTDLKNLTGV